jgi:hypothetical protein
MRVNRTPIQRFRAKVAVRPNGCWEWTAGKSRQGYGWFTEGYENGKRKLMAAHRWIYREMIGPLENKCEIHHLCENRSCVNPSHLVQLNHTQHMMVSLNSIARRNKLKECCKRGHEYVDGSWRYIKRNDWLVRYCIVCNRVRTAAYRSGMESVVDV